jgi:inner membrane protein
MRNSAIARLGVMAVITIVLMVPLALVETTVSERASRRAASVGEVSATWGGAQVLGGPVLIVPYSVTWIDNAGRTQRSLCRAVFLPQEVHVEGNLRTEIRKRGIYGVVVYHTDLKVTGRFRRPDTNWIRPLPDVDWDHATLSVGISDPRGLTRRASLEWRGQEVPFTGGTPDIGLFRSGISAAVPRANDAAGPDLPFALTLSLNGTRDVSFLPAAEETTVALGAAWPHPSFVGTALPETRQIGKDGFTARWQVQDFGRPYPARWTSAEMNGEQLAAQGNASAFGLSLIQPVDIYQQAERAVKYAVLFLVLTFLVFFLWEVFRATLLHPVQYVFVGFALCVFYLLLVSTSEHAGFDTAYAISSIVTTLLIAGYARAVLGGTRQGASVFGALAILYGFLYLLLRLEDYALLAGSIGLFVVLAFVMYITRRMNWYELKLGAQE